MRSTLAAALFAVLIAAPAFAQGPGAAAVSDPPASENGRYSMTPSGDGFLRLDTRTGKVSLCTVRDGAARCTLAADEREAYEREIALLRGQKPADPSAQGWGPRLPTDQEIDKTLGVMEKLWRGLNRIIGDNPPGDSPRPRTQGAPL